MLAKLCEHEKICRKKGEFEFENFAVIKYSKRSNVSDRVVCSQLIGCNQAFRDF